MNSDNSLKTLYQKAADYILDADVLLITAGAGSYYVATWMSFSQG